MIEEGDDNSSLAREGPYKHVKYKVFLPEEGPASFFFFLLPFLPPPWIAHGVSAYTVELQSRLELLSE